MKLNPIMQRAERFNGRRLNPNKEILETFYWDGGSIDIIEYLGGGAYSDAYLGIDGMVYIVTDASIEESSKPWLAAFYKQAKVKPLHLPAIEFLGMTQFEDDGRNFYLTRMPIYSTTSPKGWEEWIGLVISLFSDNPFGEEEHFHLIPQKYNKQMMGMFKDMDNFEKFAADYGNLDFTLYRDWNITNIGWDKDGNIVNFDGYTTNLPLDEIKHLLKK